MGSFLPKSSPLEPQDPDIRWVNVSSLGRCPDGRFECMYSSYLLFPCCVLNIRYALLGSNCKMRGNCVFIRCIVVGPGLGRLV